MSRRPPNIIVTIADDQRGSALGCAGIEPVRTPALDRLAGRGTRFARAHHLGSPHGAVCAPSRAMLLTGVPYFRLDPALFADGSAAPSRPLPPTLPGTLRERGYHTFATGKWHNGPELVQASFDSVSTLFFGGMADHWFTPVQDFDPLGKYPPEARRIADGFSTEVFAQSAIDFIRSRRGNDQPFFCYCAFTAPHDPRTPPDAFRRLYDPTSLPLPPNAVPGVSFDHGFVGVGQPRDNGALHLRDEMLLGVPRHPAEIQRSLAEYYGMISHMDAWIGRIHDALRETGLEDDTIIVHTADHGLAVGQHGLMGKQNLHQHSVGVPLLLAGPGIAPGRVAQDLCYQHDLNPTLLNAAGAVPRGDPYFRSLLSPAAPRAFVGCAYSDTQRMVRNERYKLIVCTAGESWCQLFDLRDDPWETRDLADSPAHAGIRRELAAQLTAWQQAVGDPAGNFAAGL